MAREVAAPSTAAELACLDGRIQPAAETLVPATDEGLLRGDGVFEVIRVYDGRPFALPEHLDRLERSAANLRLDGLVPRTELEEEVPRLLEARGGPAFGGCLRIVLTRGGRRLLLTEPLPIGPERARLGFVTFAPTRVLDGVKSLSYAGNMLATRMARERGFDEALLMTPHGRVLEAPTSSLFWVDGGRLCTPPLDEHILASITRDKVMQLVEVEERPCPTDELTAAEEAFLASTTREVQSIAAIEERSFPETGEVTRKAAAALRAFIDAELA
jgi:branched-chain amino acid aminotransferase